ncbi:MAG: vanadium-dependent haloperoxidase [Chitinophagales bacterium]
MKIKYLAFVLLAGIAIATGSCSKSSGGDNPLFSDKSKSSSDESAVFLTEWWDALFNFVATERLSPPDASRMFAYISVGIYEAQICGTQQYVTLEGQLNDLKDLPRPDKSKEYDWQTCVTETIYLVQDGMLSRYFPAGVSTLNKLYDKQIDDRMQAGIAQEVIDRSKEYGKELADAILEWSENDHYVETRYKQYKSPTREGHPERWEPTDFNQTALEPFWGELRPFGIKSSTQCDIDNVPTYTGPKDTTGSVYKQAMEVYNVDRTLTEAQRTVAQYWADDPGETCTPPGHWMGILGNFVKSEDMRLDRAAELYALVGISMADACITMWETKYRTNLVRPKTVIAEAIEPGWEPYVETPPFPGYTSGHSGFSQAAATVMTRLIGDNLPFIDSSHVNIGLLPRQFKSFQDAAAEAAFSRMWGGIHYTCEIEDGKEQGRCCANYILDNIVTMPSRGKSSGKETAYVKHEE